MLIKQYRDFEHHDEVLQLDSRIFGLDDPKMFDNANGFVVEDDNKTIIGYVLFQFNFNKKNLHIRSLGVDPQLRGSGIGKQLIREVLSIADDSNLNCTLAIDSHFNLHLDHPQMLRKFYASFGFQDSGVRNINDNEIWVRKI